MSGTAFTRAAAALHANQDRSIEATYTPDASRVGLLPEMVRVILSRPVEPVPGFGRGGVTASSSVASLPVQALPYEPQRQDTLVIGTETFTVETPELDVERTTWLLPLGAG